MATKKTATTITTRQIYEKVCAMEKMLKECLEGPPLAKAEPQPYLAAAAPDRSRSAPVGHPSGRCPGHSALLR